MDQECYVLDENSNKYKILSKILFIAAPILLVLVLLDIFIFSDKVDRVLHYLDVLELIGLILIAITFVRKLSVHSINKASNVVIIKNFSAALVYAVVGYLYIQMCIQVFDLPGSNPIYYMMLGISAVIFAVTQLFTGITFNIATNKLLNQKIKEKKLNILLLIAIILNVLGLIVNLVGIIGFNSFDILAFLRITLRTIVFILILLFEPLYLKCFKKQQMYEVSFKQK